MLSQICRRFLRDGSGAPAVEFAILSPVAILMVLGLADLGLAFGTRLKIESEVNSLQLESLRSPVDDVQALMQERLEAMTDTISGLTLANPVSVAEAYGCPDVADTDSPVEVGRQEDDACDCGANSCSPYRYYVISASFRYDLPFGLDVELPFFSREGGLRRIDMATQRTILVDGGWQ